MTDLSPVEKPEWWLSKAACATTHVADVLGPASSLPCWESCGQQAITWSYTVESPDPKEKVENGRAYSRDPDYYVPRCSACHIASLPPLYLMKHHAFRRGLVIV